MRIDVASSAGVSWGSVLIISSGVGSNIGNSTESIEGP